MTEPRGATRSHAGRNAALARTLEVRAIVEEAGSIRAAARMLGITPERVRQIANRSSAPPWQPPPKPRPEPVVRPPKPIEALPPGMKRCTGCLLIQPVAEFYRIKNAANRWWPRCRTCSRAAIRKWAANHQARRAAWPDPPVIPPPLGICACGCGEATKQPTSRFRQGHDSRLRSQLRRRLEGSRP